MKAMMVNVLLLFMNYVICKSKGELNRGFRGKRDANDKIVFFSFDIIFASLLYLRTK